MKKHDDGERPGSSFTYRYSLWPVNCALRLNPPDEMVVVVGEPDRAVVEVNRVSAAVSDASFLIAMSAIANRILLSVIDSRTSRQIARVNQFAG